MNILKIKKRKIERKMNKERSSIHWRTPQKPGAGRPGAGPSQQLRIPPKCPI